MAKPSFGERVRAMRLSRGLTLAVLADQAGIHLQSLAKIENGVSSNPSWDTVCALAVALGVSTDAFRDPDQPDDEDNPPNRPFGKRK